MCKPLSYFTHYIHVFIHSMHVLYTFYTCPNFDNFSFGTLNNIMQFLTGAYFQYIFRFRRNKSNKNIYVDIDGAVIKGHTIEVRRSRIASFTGIPYAQSPLGHLRFAKPNKRRYTKGNNEQWGMSGFKQFQIIIDT